LKKHWELIADKLSKAGWSWGCVSAIDSEGRTIWIVDAHRAEAVIIFSLSLRPLDGYPLVHREKAYP
jgi:hypothetical protein